jgi:hypothetical protein
LELDLNNGNTIGRGRKKSKTTFFIERTKYFKLLGRKIDRADVENYIALVMSMGIRKYTALSSYFYYNDIHLGFEYQDLIIGCDYIKNRMDRHIYSFIDNNIDFVIAYVSKLENHCLSELYVSDWKLAADESMCPSKSSKNPHHMYVPNKPHPNGILFTSVADENLIMLSLKIRRRVKEDYETLTNRNKKEMEFSRTKLTSLPKQTTVDLINDLYKYPSGSVVVVDKLYGGLKLLKVLANKGIHTIASCRKDRPSYIFSQFFILIK